MKVVVLHNQPSDDASIDEQDVLIQRDAVVAALEELGHDASALSCSLDLANLQRQLQDDRPDVVVNLVEALGGTDRLMSLAPQLLDAMHIPYTGASSAAILATGDKLAAKQRLIDAELPTPPWLVRSYTPAASNDSGRVIPRERAIVKSIWEHASLGMEDEAIVEVRDPAALVQQLARQEQLTGRPHFAEQYIEGREFNVALLTANDIGLSPLPPRVLPIAEIDFARFPPGKPRIVGYRAKWDEQSFEYHNTPRRFVFPASDQPLLKRLADLAIQCWQVFDLRGYARVDFRVDPQGSPWILEINVNPCLAPDAGFAAALEQAGIPFHRAIADILHEALRH